ncbi:hypothetical protein L1049_023511 [Liquidambar formosana]|uniref:ACB domain-containing protein n=1 Tax=Liquidambar formosana TaxID=63359 RepID=A0AAP0RT60_LIQFO
MLCSVSLSPLAKATMLFLEFLFSLALWLLLSFVISKLLTMASADGTHGSVSTSKEDTMEKEVLCDRKIGKKLRNCGNRVRFVDKVVIREVGEFEGESVHEKLNVRSPEISDAADIDANAAVGSGESCVEECCGTEEVKAGEVCTGESTSDRVDIIEENVVEESPERIKFRDIEIDLVEDEARSVKSEESKEVGVSECGGNERSEVDGGDGEGLLHDDEDWEGVERTELERDFGAAVAFVGCRSNADCVSTLGSDVQMQLYGLHKVATEGPCREPQPMALKVSARAKWNAWKQLGNMNQEAAMERYITLLSERIPRWMGDDHGGDNKQVLSDEGASCKLPSDLETFVHNQASAENDSNLVEQKAWVGGCDLIGAGGPNSMNREKQ